MKGNAKRKNFPRILLWVLLLTFGTAVLGACSSARKYPPKHRQIKKGKPIPCPMKDC